MTTEQPQAQRRLRRRTDDRVIAGVASGLGDYFNVDPLLIRIALVASIVFGGLGIFFYAAAWLLMPPETDERSVAERLRGRAGIGGVGGLLVLLGAAVFISILVDISARSGAVGGVAFAILVVAVGAVLLTRGAPDGAEAPAIVETTADAATGETTAGPAVEAQPGETTRTVVRRTPRAPSPLGWYVTGAGLVGIGLLAVATNVTGMNVAPGQYFGLALAVIGGGLLVGTLWGHARLLIVLGLVILPFAYAASLVEVPIEGGWGSHRFSPATVDEVRDEYRLVGGELQLDLTDVDGGSEPIVIAASVAMGELIVLLPDDANVELDAAVGGGSMRILGTRESGTHLSEQRVSDGDGPQFVLDLEAGLALIRVETVQTEGQ